jgi:hypothetical protein
MGAACRDAVLLLCANQDEFQKKISEERRKIKIYFNS